MKHLDIGSGLTPKNPYGADELYGIDIQDNISNIPNYKSVNLFTDKIPFNNNFFDSVSAFDFLEHVPRVWLRDNGQSSFPFIDLMSDIYRVLRPKGKFYAMTPYYPKHEAFQDPTHVNIITKKTHEYFCGNNCYGKYYGFSGNFKKIRVKTTSVKLGKKAANVSLIYKIYDLKRKLMGKHTHLLWELEKA